MRDSLMALLGMAVQCVIWGKHEVAANPVKFKAEHCFSSRVEDIKIHYSSKEKNMPNSLSGVLPFLSIELPVAGPFIGDTVGRNNKAEWHPNRFLYFERIRLIIPNPGNDVGDCRGRPSKITEPKFNIEAPIIFNRPVPALFVDSNSRDCRVGPCRTAEARLIQKQICSLNYRQCVDTSLRSGGARLGGFGGHLCGSDGTLQMARVDLRSLPESLGSSPTRFP